MSNTASSWPESSFFKTFITQNGLNKKQEEQIRIYVDLLMSWNEDMNLTTIVKPENIIAYHFQDALHVDQFYDFSKIKMYADIGTGAGFPGLPLKIKYPHLSLVLIEVNTKRIRFLQEVIAKLGLQDVSICDKDWRTFLRKTDYPIDLFITRASLSMSELMRMYKPACQYACAEFIYWASDEWELEEKYTQFFKKEVAYQIKNRKRRYIFFASPQSRCAK